MLMSVYLTHHKMYYLMVLLVLLTLADGLISRFLTGNGLGQELNPFLQSIISEGNFLLLKTAGSLLVALILWDIYRRQPKTALISAAVCVAFYTTILYWNLVVYFISNSLL
jgi:hypothetical protein